MIPFLQNLEPTIENYIPSAITSDLLFLFKKDDQIILISKETNFYAEKGGQVSDIGHIFIEKNKLTVKDVQYFGKIIFHILEDTEEQISELKNKISNKNIQISHIEDKNILNCDNSNNYFKNIILFYDYKINNSIKLKLLPNFTRQNGIKKHHTATHLLNYQIHLKGGFQAGSKVEEEKLRFDYENCKLNMNELKEIEEKINLIIKERKEVFIRNILFSEILAKENEEMKKNLEENLKNIKINENKNNNLDLNSKKIDDESKKICIFNKKNKYPEIVRVVSVPTHKELCSGLHVQNTSEILDFLIISENSIAKNKRRILAICGENAIKLRKEDEKKIEVIIELNKSLEKKISNLSEIEKNYNEKDQIFYVKKLYYDLIDIFKNTDLNENFHGHILKNNFSLLQVKIQKLEIKFKKNLLNFFLKNYKIFEKNEFFYEFKLYGNKKNIFKDLNFIFDKIKENKKVVFCDQFFVANEEFKDNSLLNGKEGKIIKNK